MKPSIYIRSTGQGPSGNCAVDGQRRHSSLFLGNVGAHKFQLETHVYYILIYFVCTVLTMFLVSLTGNHEHASAGQGFLVSAPHFSSACFALYVASAAPSYWVTECYSFLSQLCLCFLSLWSCSQPKIHRISKNKPRSSKIIFSAIRIVYDLSFFSFIFILASHPLSNRLTETKQALCGHEMLCHGPQKKGLCIWSWVTHHTLKPNPQAFVMVKWARMRSRLSLPLNVQPIVLICPLSPACRFQWLLFLICCTALRKFCSCVNYCCLTRISETGSIGPRRRLAARCKAEKSDFNCSCTRRSSRGKFCRPKLIKCHKDLNLMKHMLKLLKLKDERWNGKPVSRLALNLVKQSALSEPPHKPFPSSRLTACTATCMDEV